MKTETIAILLTLIFVVLKLTETIDWSWWWVLSPLLFLLGFLFLIGFVLGGFTALSKH